MSVPAGVADHSLFVDSSAISVTILNHVFRLAKLRLDGRSGLTTRKRAVNDDIAQTRTGEEWERIKRK